MTHASRSFFAPAVAALCLLPLLAGCGQKGPLYLPGDEREVETEITLPDGLDDEEAEREEAEPVEDPR